MNQPKIISLSTTYPESTTSTKPKFVHALNKELVNLGLDVTVICPHSKGYPTQLKLDSVLIKFFKYLPEKYQINQLSIPDAAKSMTGKLKIMFMITNFFLTTFRICMTQKSYVLHGHWAFPAGYIAYLISKFFKKHFLVTVHGSEIPLLKKFAFIKKLVVNSLNKSSGVIVSNNYMKNKLIELGVIDKKIHLIRPIPNFVEHVSDMHLISQFKKNSKIPEKKVVLFVGRLTEVKGVEFLIRAFSEIQIQDTHLVIIGDGILSSKLTNLAQSLGLSDKITFFGSANSKELSFLYSLSEVFVLPSIVDSTGATEATGLVILEAMDAGLPVIASKVGGIPETIQDEVNGLLVNQKDPKSIAKAIERILTDNHLRDKIVKNSKETVKEFLPQSIAKKYYDIFASISK